METASIDAAYARFAEVLIIEAIKAQDIAWLDSEGRKYAKLIGRRIAPLDDLIQAFSDYKSSVGPGGQK